MIEFSKKLKELRESKKMTKTYMARELGLSLSSYSTYENGYNTLGDREPNLQNLIKIAQVFKISIDELLNYSVDEMESYSEMWESAGFEVYQENEKFILKRHLKNEKENYYASMFENADLLEVPEDRLIFDNNVEFLEFSKKVKLIYQKETKKQFEDFAKILFADIKYNIALKQSLKQDAAINSDGDYLYSELKKA